MHLQFSPDRLSEFQALYAEHYGREITLEQAETKLTALVRLLAVCTGAAGGEGRDSNPAPVSNIKICNE